VRLTVTVSPHIHRKVSIKTIMYAVVGALMPALAGAVYFFGWRALYITILACASAVFSEWLARKCMRREFVLDGSAIITGILLAFNLPVNVSWWIPVIGSAFAIIIAKQLFGGLGYNILNPALAGRAFLMASWPTEMTAKWSAPIRPAGSTISGLVENISQATPLNTLKLYGQKIGAAQFNDWSTIKHLFIGNVGGSLGETSALLLLIGGLFLILFKFVDWRIPLAYIGTLFGLTSIAYLTKLTPASPLFHILSGGVFLGAFFMATDYVTSPVTKKGRWIFGIGCGIITFIIRLWGGYPEGVCFSILLMNCATPLIERYTRPKRFGT